MPTGLGRRPATTFALAFLVLLAGCVDGAHRSAPTAGSGSPGPAGGRIRRVGGVDIAEVGTEVPADALPYPYVSPPPRNPTPIDGTYLRILSLEDLPDVPFPTRCLRCPPFFVHAGVSTLMFHEGRYWLNHQLSGFRSLGHYTVEGNTVTLINDPHCPREGGTYRWKLQEGAYSFGANVRISFKLLGGDCVYEGARASDLTRVPWRKIDPCSFRFVHLWPARPECV